MLCAVAARRFGMQDRLVLTGVQVSPPAFRLMVIEGARAPAFRTRPRCSDDMDQMNVNLSSIRLQFDEIDAPRGSNPQDLGI